LTILGDFLSLDEEDEEDEEEEEGEEAEEEEGEDEEGEGKKDSSESFTKGHMPNIISFVWEGVTLMKLELEEEM
jgi:hypothetical protein